MKDMKITPNDIVIHNIKDTMRNANTHSILLTNDGGKGFPNNASIMNVRLDEDDQNSDTVAVIRPALYNDYSVALDDCKSVANGVYPLKAVTIYAEAQDSFWNLCYAFKLFYKKVWSSDNSPVQKIMYIVYKYRCVEFLEPRLFDPDGISKDPETQLVIKSSALDWIVFNRIPLGECNDKIIDLAEGYGYELKEIKLDEDGAPICKEE